MSILDKDLTTLAFCWRMERRDGVTLGFTTHDRDVEVGGLIYRAAPGMLPSAISLSDRFDADSLDIKGALTSNAITADDLGAGRWDGAEVQVFLIDWEAPETERVPLANGVLGDVGMIGNGFSAELRGATALLDRPVVEQTSPECRAELGDKRCRVDMAGRGRSVRVVSVPEENAIDIDGVAGATYLYGRARWISGPNSGIESLILGSDGGRIVFRDAPPFAPQAGDLIEIRQGCDKRFETCRTRFGNSLNFRGEPHLPGMDLLMRYPGA